MLLVGGLKPVPVQVQLKQLNLNRVVFRFAIFVKTLVSII